MRQDGCMPTALETALQAIDATEHDAAWALVREAELVVPAVVADPKNPASGRYLTIQHGDLTVVLAFTSQKKVGGFLTQTKRAFKTTGEQLAAGVPEGAAIGLNLGQPDSRLFLNEVITA